MKRGSSTSMTPRSGSSSTLASRSSEPNAAVKRSRFSFQALCRSALASARRPHSSARAIRQPKLRGDRRESLARLPSTSRPNGYGCAAARGIPRCRRRLPAPARPPCRPSDLEQPKQPLVARPRQSAIEEHRHGGQDDAAVGIVLHLLRGGVADAHRSVAAIALQVGRGAFIHRHRSAPRCRPAAAARPGSRRC